MIDDYKTFYDLNSTLFKHFGRAFCGEYCV